MDAHETRRTVIGVNVTPSEKAEIEAAARAEDRSVSAWVRVAMFAKLKESEQ